MSVSTNVSVWFACKLCTSYFIKVSDFIDHKKKDHLEEFQKSSCIVFEERTVSTHESTHDDKYDGSLLPVEPLPTVSPNLQRKIIPIPTPENLPSSSPEPGSGPGPGPSSNVIVITRILEPETNYDPNTVTVDLHYDSRSLDSTTLQNLETDQNQGFNFSSFIDLPHKPSQVENDDAVSNEFDNESVKSGDGFFFNTDDDELEVKPDQEVLSRLEVKPQLVTCAKSPPSQILQNPAVRIKRLTPKQIQTVSSSSTVPVAMPKINSRFEKLKNITAKDDIFILPDSLANSLAPTPTNNSITECALCLKKFESDSDLKTHIGIACEMYNRFRERYCIPCNRKFNNKGACENHNLRFHVTEEEKLKKSKLCGVCGKSYIRNCDLKEHVLKKHIGVPRPRPFKCILCNFGFQTRFALTSHLRTHSEDKPFRCSHPNCEMAFKLKSYLTQHLKSHSDYRPWPCTELACGKSFKTRKHLANHMVTHTDFRPFQCPEPNCRKTFQLAYMLHKHRKIHTRAKETAANPTTSTPSAEAVLS